MIRRLALPAAFVLALSAVVGGAAGCEKPTSDECESALRNMQRILGTDTFTDNASLQGEIRRCRGGSSKVAVACATKAETLEDLNKCDFERLGKRGGLPSGAAGSAGTGSAAAGSAGTGSAGAGSAAAGSPAAAGSATAGSPAGSPTAEGSATNGSAAAGSPAAAGSAAAGSAAAAAK